MHVASGWVKAIASTVISYLNTGKNMFFIGDLLLGIGNENSHSVVRLLNFNLLKTIHN